MIAMESFPPLMFAGLIAVMLIGFPVAFSLAALGMACGFFAVSQGWFPPEFMSALPQNVFGILSNDLLLAIPFFTLMGALLEKCGLAEDMLDSMGQLFGPVRGGLGYSVIIVGFILGAITGTVAGQVIAMAMISLPVMMRYGYNMRYATGVLAASGTITQLVPPSLVLVVLADQLGKSVGDMYLGAIGPSILQVAIFMLFILFMSIVRLSPGGCAELPAPRGRSVFLYVARGSASVGDSAVERWHLVTLNDDGDSVAVTAGADGAVLLYGHADPIGEPVVAHGPFVMNSEAEIGQAIADYQAGKFQGDGKLIEVG